MKNRMPALFLGHGNPMNALAKNGYTEGWAALGKSMPRPRAVPVFDWAARFEAQVRKRLIENDDETLVNYLSLDPEAALSVPTPDHYLPLLYVLGLRRENDAVSFPVQGVDGGSISMLAVQIG